MFTEKPNPKDKKSPLHRQKAEIKEKRRTRVFTEETRRLNTQSTLSCTPNNQCSQNIAGLLRTSQETNQLNRTIVALDTALNTIPNMLQHLSEELTVAASKFRAEKLDKYIDGLKSVSALSESELYSEANSEVIVFFSESNADKVQTLLNQSEANLFFRSIYEKAKEKFRQLEEQFTQLQKHIEAHQNVRDKFNRQLEMTEHSFALFESLLVNVDMYNDPKRPAEQKAALEGHRRNLSKFDQNITTFETYIIRHTQGLSTLQQLLHDMEKIIGQNTASLKCEELTKLTPESSWIFDWTEKNYRRLFEAATKEVDKEFVETETTLSNFLGFLEQRRQSSIEQVTRFKKYPDQEAAAQCARNFKFENKNDEHTQALKEILSFTYTNNLDFYTRAQQIIKQNSKPLCTRYKGIFELVNARKKAAFKMLSNLKSLDPALTPLIENFLLSNLRGGIKVLKTLSVFLKQENIARQTALREKIEKFFEDNPMKDNLTISERMLRSFKAYKLSSDFAATSERLDAFEDALSQASKDLQQRKSSPEMFYQFTPTSTTPMPSPSQDVFKEPSKLQLSEHAKRCFQEDKTLLETIEQLFNTEETIYFVKIRRLIDILRHDGELTPSKENHVLYKLPDIWENISLKKQVLVAFPHGSKPDEAPIADPNKRAELKRGFFEAGLRPELIRSAAIQTQLIKAPSV